MDAYRIYWRNIIVISFVVGLSACAILDFSGSEQGGPDAAAKPVTQTAADKKHEAEKLDTYQPPRASAKQEDRKSSIVDCARLGAGPYYLTEPDTGEKVTLVKVEAMGFGAPPKSFYPAPQRRLMTMRASKIDAYRALAEVVAGLHIWGGATVAEMVLEKDRYRSFVDAYVRGARVKRVEEQTDATVKTIVEMDVDQRFLSQVSAFVDPVVNRHCFDTEKTNYTHYGDEQGSSSFYYGQ